VLTLVARRNLMTSSTDGITVEVLAPGERSGALGRLEPGGEYMSSERESSVSVRSLAEVSNADLQRGIESVCSAVTAALAKSAPDSCDVEFSLGFKAGAKVPILMAGEANGSLKVTLRWKRANSAAASGSKP
jgi:Trypsin-co-occurring domain 1